MASERIQRRVDRLLDQIEEAMERLDWESVRSSAQAVLALDAGNPDALAFLDAAEQAMGGSSGTAAGPSTVSGPAGPTTDQPASFANGRYQVKRFLGEGGRKKVYLAHDTLLDREVALAIIKTEGLDEVSRTRITREAQAMGRLGSHPHIVTVFDLGQETGTDSDQPYMVTELMGGGDVEGLIEKAVGHMVPLEQAIELAKEVCRGLDFAHGQGIVHRDLKPGNVWLTQDGTAKIGDFGLAVVLDRSRLTTEGMMVGTVSYMPPEQAMGGAVTPRSDLYSLGAMLYELVTGRPPFLGDDSVAIIGQHINTPPVAPTWHNAQCPRPLDALILRLLAKDPSERPASASDVLAALDAIDLTTSVERPAVAVDQAHALDSLAGGVFVGRQREMGDLKAALEDALSGRGRLVTLVGEPGIGKTRTAQELATYAGLRQAQVLWGRCYEGEGAPPYWPWVQAIRSYVRDQDAELLRSEMGAGAADIAQIVSDVKDQLPGLEIPPELEPEQARFRLFDSITAFLKNAARLQPLMLVLDDIHWADEPSLLLLRFLAQQLSDSCIFVVGCYPRQHPLSDTLAQLSREQVFQRHLLRGLSRDETELLVEETAGIRPSHPLVENVFAHTEGNPYFLTEVVRLFSQQRESSEIETGGPQNLRIPEGVREVIGQRLNRLSQQCNRILATASIIGREFSLDQLDRLPDNLSEDEVLDALEEALKARLIEELPQEVGRYQFAHRLAQETLIQELSLTRRVRLHARIGLVLEELYGADAEAHAAELAYHFAQAETVTGTDKLVRYSLLAGDQALAAYAYEEAESNFRRALEAKEGQPNDAETAGLLFGLGRAQALTILRSQALDALNTLKRAFQCYVDAGDVDGAVAVAEYQVNKIIGVVTGTVELVSQALELVPADSHQAGRLLSTYGLMLYQETFDYEGARESFEGALAIARREQDPALELRTLAGAAEVAWHRLSLPEVLEYGQRAVDLTRQIDDPPSEIVARLYLQRAQTVMGHNEAAKLNAAAVLATTERLRDRGRQEEALMRNAQVRFFAGEWQDARRFLDAALATNNLRLGPLSTLSVLEHEEGNFAQGAATIDQLMEVSRRRSAELPGFA